MSFKTTCGKGDDYEGCGAEIVMQKDGEGKWHPLNPDKTPHKCDKFKRVDKKKESHTEKATLKSQDTTTYDSGSLVEVLKQIRDEFRRYNDWMEKHGGE